MDTTLLKQQIAEAVSVSGLSAAKVSRLANGNPSLIKNIMAGHMPRVDSLARLADVLGTSFCIGASDDPPDLFTAVPLTGAATPLESAQALAQHAVEIMQYLAARLADHQDLEDYAVVRCHQGNPIHVAFRQDWLRGQRLQTDRLTLVWMQDDSMQPTLSPGDSVLIDTARRQPGSGQVFGLRVDGEPIVARLRSDGSQWLAEGDNQGHKQRVVSDVDAILGRAVWWAHTEP